MAKATHLQKEDQETMVLRTVYLPAEMDEELKKLAFHGSTSKGDLIRQAVKKLVEGKRDSQPATAEQSKEKGALKPE